LPNTSPANWSSRSGFEAARKAVRLGQVSQMERRYTFSDQSFIRRKGLRSKLRILVIHDDPLAREGLQRLINTQPDLDVVGLVASGWNALQRAYDLQPDLAVLDVSSPELGVEAIVLLRRACPSLKILALITGEEEHGRQLLAAGASGYLSRPIAEPIFLQALRDADRRARLKGMD